MEELILELVSGVVVPDPVTTTLVVDVTVEFTVLVTVLRETEVSVTVLELEAVAKYNQYPEAATTMRMMTLASSGPDVAPYLISFTLPMQ